MPTIRSEFTIEQFEAVFQKRAYQIALDALQKLLAEPKDSYTGLQIVARGPKLQLVSTSGESVKFESEIVYSKTIAKWNTLFFTIEEKLYAQSSHSTKISFYCDPKEVKNVQSKVQAIIDELMTGIKPIPRFSLAQKNK